MASREYIFKDPNDPTKLKIESRSHAPKKHFGAPPIDPLTNRNEDVLWLQIENIADPETGQLVPTVTVNIGLKETILAQRIVDEDDRKAKDKTKKDKIKKIKADLGAFNINDVKDLASIKESIRMLFAAVSELQSKLD